MSILNYRKIIKQLLIHKVFKGTTCARLQLSGENSISLKEEKKTIKHRAVFTNILQQVF